LFEGNQNLNDTLSIFQEIRKLVNSRKISLYFGNTGWCITSTRQYINHKLSSEFWSNGYDSLYEYNPFFEFSIQSDFPLVDEYGEPIIVTDTNGFQMHVYPPRTIEPIHLRDIYELQIVEVYTEGKFVPSRIGSCTVEDGNITELFWMDIKSVKKANTNTALTNWIEDIQNKKIPVSNSNKLSAQINIKDKKRCTLKVKGLEFQGLHSKKSSTFDSTKKYDHSFIKSAVMNTGKTNRNPSNSPDDRFFSSLPSN